MNRRSRHRRSDGRGRHRVLQVFEIMTATATPRDEHARHVEHGRVVELGNGAFRDELLPIEWRPVTRTW
jgi:hypothetical protein